MLIVVVRVSKGTSFSKYLTMLCITLFLCMIPCPPLSLHQSVQVVCLREAERHLRLRCKELELQVGEQEDTLNELEVSMQRLALDADRRLTQQHRDHQNNIQLLLQKLQGRKLLAT